MATIQLRRGLDANVAAAAAADGEPLWTTDTHELYVGQGGTAYLVGGSGTVTSVGLTVPAWMSLGGTNPVTTSGTINVGTASASANQVLASPDGSAGSLSVRALVTDDLADGLVTLPKLADIASECVLGNTTGSAAPPHAIGPVSTEGVVLRFASGTISWGALDLASANATVNALGPTRGGTNQSTYTTGDLLYASAADTLSKRAIGSAGDFLWVSGGVPAWHAPAMENIAGYCTSLTNSGTISASDSTWTSLTWDTEASDDAGLHSTVTNTQRITIPAGMGGVYLLNVICQFAANATGLRSLRFILNGSTVFGEVGGWNSANALQMSLTRVVRLAAGDFVVAQAYQTSGGNLNLNPSAGNYLAAAYLGK